MTTASTDALPRMFDAVAGHVENMFYGNDTDDGRKTLQKKTTAWEVMHYLGMHFPDDIAVFLAGRQRDGASKQGALGPDSGECAAYVEAVQGMRGFTSELFSVRLPQGWQPGTASLLAVTRELWAPDAADHHHHHHQPRWLEVRDARWRALWAPLFVELFDGAAAVEGYSTYDAQEWGIGLVDVTSRYQEPSVMDLKVGYLRYNTYTPAAKVAKINGKDAGTVLRREALRIAGLRRFVHSRGGGTVEEERQGKPIGFAIPDAALMRCYTRAFFSTDGRLAAPRSCGTGLDDSAGTQGRVENPVDLVDRSTVGESDATLRRCAIAHGVVSDILHFFRDTADGQYLLRHFAFVATSVLCTYDAADSTDATCTVTLIDFAMSGVRRLNYSEEKVGFLAGLQNLAAYLA